MRSVSDTSNIEAYTEFLRLFSRGFRKSPAGWILKRDRWCVLPVYGLKVTWWTTTGDLKDFSNQKLYFFSPTETSAWKRNQGLLKFPSTENQRWWGCGCFGVRNVHQQKVCGMGSSYLNPIVFFSQFQCPSFCHFSVAAVVSWCIWSVLCWPSDVLGYHRDDFQKD